MFDPGLYNYYVVIVLMMTGLYVVIAKDNLIKKVIGLNVFQVSVIMFYVSLSTVTGGTPPIVVEGHEAHSGTASAETAETAEAEPLYSNPVPHVLMLTAIVVGVATTALALALVVRIHEEYGTIEEFEIRQLEGDDG